MLRWIFGVIGFFIAGPIGFFIGFGIGYLAALPFKEGESGTIDPYLNNNKVEPSIKLG